VDKYGKCDIDGIVAITNVEYYDHVTLYGMESTSSTRRVHTFHIFSLLNHAKASKIDAFDASCLKMSILMANPMQYLETLIT
jgi:hypothetical protein